jgi:transcriptional regulator
VINQFIRSVLELSPRGSTSEQILWRLTKAENELVLLGRRVPQAVEKRKNIVAIIEYLDGQGDPNILFEIEKEDEDDRS